MIKLTIFSKSSGEKIHYFSISHINWRLVIFDMISYPAFSSYTWKINFEIPFY